MKKIKLDVYELRVLINGLYAMKDRCFWDRDSLSAMIINLIDLAEEMKLRRRKRIPFCQNEIVIISQALIEWRNQFIRSGEDVCAEVVGELLMKFI